MPFFFKTKEKTKYVERKTNSFVHWIISRSGQNDSWQSQAFYSIGRLGIQFCSHESLLHTFRKCDQSTLSEQSGQWCRLESANKTSQLRFLDRNIFMNQFWPLLGCKISTRFEKIKSESNWTDPNLVGISTLPSYENRQVVLTTKTASAFVEFMNSIRFPFSFDHAIGFLE